MKPKPYVIGLKLQVKSDAKSFSTEYNALFGDRIVL